MTAVSSDLHPGVPGEPFLLAGVEPCVRFYRSNLTVPGDRISGK